MKTIIGTISHGTMRTQDLIPAFLDALSIVNPEGYSQYLLMPFGVIPSDASLDENDEWWVSEDAGYILEGLFDALDECSPDGYYFGAHPGDGSDYGFWQIEDKEL